MIIEKTYNDLKPDRTHYLSVREIEDIILKKIYVLALNDNIQIDYNTHFIVNYDFYSILEDSPSFTHHVVYERTDIGNMELMGSIFNYNVYYDKGFDSDKILIGTDFNETKKYITTKKRKEKLKKINGV